MSHCAVRHWVDLADDITTLHLLFRAEIVYVASMCLGVCTYCCTYHKKISGLHVWISCGHLDCYYFRRLHHIDHISIFLSFSNHQLCVSIVYVASRNLELQKVHYILHNRFFYPRVWISYDYLDYPYFHMLLHRDHNSIYLQF